jgi:hypothetical protein
LPVKYSSKKSEIYLTTGIMDGDNPVTNQGGEILLKNQGGEILLKIKEDWI